MLNKYFILTTLLFLFCILTCAQNSIVSDSIVKRLHIKEAVKKTYFGENKIPSNTYTDFYDRSGKLIKRISVNHNSISNKQFYFYNKIGQLIKERNISFDKDDSTIYTLKFLYNKKGLLNSNSFGKINYKFDNYGRVIESIEKTAKPSNLRITFTYDSLGRLTNEEKYFYNSKDKMTTWYYNDKGQIIKETRSYFFYSKDNMPNSEYENTFEYNEMGLIITEFQKQIISTFGEKSENRIYTYEYSFY